MKKMLVFISILVVLFGVTTAYSDSKALDSIDHNKSVVLRYFKEVLDGWNVEVMDELFTTDVIMHRPEGDLSPLSQIKMIFKVGSSSNKIETTIHDIIGSKDRVVVRLSHKQVFAEGGYIRNRVGFHKVGGKTIIWDAIAIFRFKDGKIAEEWVQFDDVAKLMQIGKINLTTF